MNLPNNYDRDIGRLAELENAFDTGPLEVIVRYDGDIRALEAEHGVMVEDLGEGYAIVTLRGDRIPRLYDHNEVIYVELPKTLTLSLNQSIDASCVPAARSSGGYGLTGKGVLIGVIDSGIDYTHPDFRKEDGSSRILYLWDQTENGRPPLGFWQGTEYDLPRLNMALNAPNPLEVVPSVDLLGHGTAVAGIAAGNGRASGGRESGVAREAELIIVKLGYKGSDSFARTTQIMRALKYVTDKAEALGMSAAVNISYGSNDGPHDGSSLFETYIDAVAQRQKIVVVVAAGNEGAAGHHFSGVLGSGRTVNADFAVAERLNYFYLTLWKHFSDYMTLELVMPDGSTTGIIDPSRSFTELNMDGVSILAYYGQPTHYNEAQEVFIRVSGRAPYIPQGVWRLRVNAVKAVDGRFDIWLPTAEEVGAGTAFTAPSPETTLTLPSTAGNVITVGGYNSATDAIAPFSGRGFTRNKVYAKPDLVAPAVGIVSARAGGGYDSFTGTSMAAPFVAGAAALMMQWGVALGNDTFLYGQRVKAYLKKGARRRAGITYPSPLWGYGALCLKDSIDFLTGSAPL